MLVRASPLLPPSSPSPSPSPSLLPSVLRSPSPLPSSLPHSRTPTLPPCRGTHHGGRQRSWRHRLRRLRTGPRLPSEPQREEPELSPLHRSRCLLQMPRSSAVPVRSPVSHRPVAMSLVHTPHESSLQHHQHQEPTRFHTPLPGQTRSSTASSPHSDSHDRDCPGPTVDSGPLPESPQYRRMDTTITTPGALIPRDPKLDDVEYVPLDPPTLCPLPPLPCRTSSPTKFCITYPPQHTWTVSLLILLCCDTKVDTLLTKVTVSGE